MRKYLILANSSDGLFKFRNELISELAKENEIISYTPNDGCWDEMNLVCQTNDIKMDRRGTNPFRDLFLILKYAKIIKREKPDIVITYTIKPAIYGGICCRLFNVEYAINITGLGTALEQKGFLRRIIIVLYKIALKKAKVVFFENSDNAFRCIEYGILKENRVCILAGAGVNTEKFHFCEYPELHNRINFLFIGRVMREKGIEELIEAMRLLYKEGHDVWLDVVGPYEEDYSAMISMMEKIGFGKYHGLQNDVRVFIKKADCFVLPSYHEGMANTNLECAAMGRPVITSNIPGCREAVLEGYTGFVCEPQNVDSLKKTIEKFIHLSYEQKKDMGKFARKHIEKNFEKKVVVNDTINALNNY